MIEGAICGDTAKCLAYNVLKCSFKTSERALKRGSKWRTLGKIAWCSSDLCQWLRLGKAGHTSAALG